MKQSYTTKGYIIILLIIIEEENSRMQILHQKSGTKGNKLLLLWYSNSNQKCLKSSKRNIFLKFFQAKLTTKSYTFSDEQRRFISKTDEKLFFDKSFHLM